MIETAPFPEQSVALLLAIETHTMAPGEIRVAFLKRVHERHPRDFWVNARLGRVLMSAGKPEEAVGYYQAALAIRPGVAIDPQQSRLALTRANRSDEAIGHFRQAVALDPAAGASHLNLVVALWNLGRQDEALRELPEALRLNPRSAVLRTFAGKALERQQPERRGPRPAPTGRRDRSEIHGRAKRIAHLPDAPGASG